MPAAPLVRDIYRVRPQRHGFDDVGAGADGAARHQDDICPRMPSSRSRWSTAASASSMGMPTLSRMRVGAAPVPPRKPSMAMMSAPLRAMPAGDGRHVVHRGDFHDDGLFIVRWLPSGE